MFHLEPMKNKSPWTLFEDSKSTLADMTNHKVVSVCQVRRGLIYKWSGELDDDRYFMITVTDGAVIGSVSEHEMMLPYCGKLLALHELVANLSNIKDISSKIIATLEAQKELVAFMKKLAFEDIMKIFKWKYVSKKVELYEDPICLMQR